MQRTSTQEPAGTAARSVPPYLSTEAILRHPRFTEAAVAMTDGLANLHGDDPKLVRSLFEYSRAVTYQIAICIAFNERDDDPATWLSVGTLAAAAAQMGIGPLRRVRRFVEEMRGDGFLIDEPMPGDRRRHRLRPSERMLAIDRDWVAVFHVPLALLVPGEPRYLAGVERDPEYNRVYRQVGLSTLEIAHQTMIAHPAVDSFMHQASGARVLLTLIRETRDSADGWTAPGFYSRAAEFCLTTRVHVRNMLRDAEAAGLVEIGDAREVRVRVMPGLRDDYAAWVANCLSSTDLVSAMAARMIPNLNL